MTNCYVCGNNYDKCFEVVIMGSHYQFDCFECAIQALAPICQHCDCRIIGHGVEEKGMYFCCVHCAKAEGIVDLRDRG